MFKKFKNSFKFFDFISLSPGNKIFQERTNKKSCGALLFFMFFLLVILITIYYCLEYTFCDDYEIKSFVSQPRTITEAQRKKFIESNKYNPSMQLRFTFWDERGRNLSDRFILIDRSGKEIKRNEIIERRINNFNFVILYKCENNETDCEIDEKDKAAYYQIYYEYQGFVIKPQNEKPIEQIPKNTFQSNYIAFNANLKTYNLLTWNIIRYRDYPGFNFFRKDDEEEEIMENNIHVGGKIKKYDTFFLDNNYIHKENYRFITKFSIIHFPNTYEFEYEDYKRKEKKIVDIFPAIFSLSISVFNGFVFIFSFLYAQSFDNYKIIENIVKRESYKNPQKKEDKNNHDDDKDNNHNNDDNENNKKEKLLDNNAEREDSEIHINISSINEYDIEDNIEVKKENEENIKELPKTKWYQIFGNYIFPKCCCSKNKMQIFLNSCNEIVLKYFSVENIIYHLILFENLLQDYIWNNPKLLDITNNESFKVINNYINSKKNNY